MTESCVTCPVFVCHFRVSKLQRSLSDSKYGSVSSEFTPLSWPFTVQYVAIVSGCHHCRGVAESHITFHVNRPPNMTIVRDIRLISKLQNV